MVFRFFFYKTFIIHPQPRPLPQGPELYRAIFSFFFPFEALLAAELAALLLVPQASQSCIPCTVLTHEPAHRKSRVRACGCPKNQANCEGKQGDMPGVCVCEGH